MAQFMVKLQNGANGALEIDPTTGKARTVSPSRTLYMQDENLERVILNDGDIIDSTDDDYWSQFVYVPGSTGNTSLENAFLVEVLC